MSKKRNVERALDKNHFEKQLAVIVYYLENTEGQIDDENYDRAVHDILSILQKYSYASSKSDKELMMYMADKLQKEVKINEPISD